MTRSAENPTPCTWRLDPRDPVVFRNGARAPALVPRHPGWLPPQTTVAGLVRARFVSNRSRVPKAEARTLLDVHLRGPWLARWPEGSSAPPELWAPVPADAVQLGHGEERRFLRGELVTPGDEAGVSWLEATPPLRCFVELPGRVDGIKTRPPRFPFWPLDAVVEWNLGGEVRGLESGSLGRPVAPEHRVQVALDDDTGTAEAEALYSSGGVRFREGFGLAVEVTDRRDDPDPPAPAPGDPAQLVVLGGESRTTRSTVEAGGCFPPFDRYRDRYRQRLDQLASSGVPLGLRLQLLTPGCFTDWQPPWSEELTGRLHAACFGRYLPVSGWNLQARRPRAVRRLVPAGALYFLGPFPRERVLELCEKTWCSSLCEGIDGHPESFLAPPAHDGYGLVLPAPCSLPRESLAKEES